MLCIVGVAVLIIIVLAALLASRDKELDKIIQNGQKDKQVPEQKPTAAPVTAKPVPPVQQPGQSTKIKIPPRLWFIQIVWSTCDKAPIHGNNNMSGMVLMGSNLSPLL